MPEEAIFTYRGVQYKAYGYPERDYYFVERVDEKQIRGVKMCPGMIQIGVSRQLEKAAINALRDAFGAAEHVSIDNDE